MTPSIQFSLMLERNRANNPYFSYIRESEYLNHHSSWRCGEWTAQGRGDEVKGCWQWSLGALVLIPAGNSLVGRWVSTRFVIESSWTDASSKALFPRGAATAVLLLCQRHHPNDNKRHTMKCMLTFHRFAAGQFFSGVKQKYVRKMLASCCRSPHQPIFQYLRVWAKMNQILMYLILFVSGQRKTHHSLWATWHEDNRIHILLGVGGAQE